jgi:hypothetical protein
MILKHRDKELLRFAWIEPQGVLIVSVNNRIHRVGAAKNGLWEVLSRQD